MGTRGCFGVVSGQKHTSLVRPMWQELPGGCARRQRGAAGPLETALGSPRYKARPRQGPSRQLLPGEQGPRRQGNGCVAGGCTADSLFLKSMATIFNTRLCCRPGAVPAGSQVPASESP